jgi:MFS family permease
VAWLAEAAGALQARALSFTITTAGLAGIVGPAFAGVLVQRFGLAAPFLSCAIATAAVVSAMALSESEAGQRLEGVPPLLQTMRAAMGSRLILSSLLLMTLGGFVGGATNLLAPLQLHHNGLSSAAIGVAFSAAAIAFIASSGLVARFGERAARVEVGVIATVLMSATLLIVVVSTTTPAVLSFLLLRGPIAAVMFTITFPLGVVGARAAGVSLSAVAALLNMVWAGSALVGPILAGAISQAASPEASYLVVIVMALAGSAWMATAGRAPRVARERDCSRTVTGR